MSKVIAKGMDIPVDQIKPSPYQPRLNFDLEDIKGSIIRDGILVALTVRKKDGFYELIDGERRWRVAKELGYKTVPCDVIDIDDETARRMVWKVNTLRKDYEPKEKALFFKKMQEEYGMSLRAIAREYDTEPHTVKAYLNVFKLPEEYQQMVWDRIIPIGVIRELEQLFNGVAYATREENPEIFEILDRAATEKQFGQKEAQEAIRPYLAKLREKQVEKAKEALAEIKPEVKPPEKPEELERVARVLIEEAKRRKSPEQILREKQEKVEKALEKGKKSVVSLIEKAKQLGLDVKWMKDEVNKIKNRIKLDPEGALTDVKTLKKQINDVIRQAEEKLKEEELRRKIEKEIEEKTVEKMLKSPEFIEMAKALPTPIVPSPTEEVTIPPEEIEAIKKRYEEVQRKISEIARLPEVRKRGELFRNWHSHYVIFQGLQEAFCPNCGKEKSGKLVWSCCNLPAEEALKMAGDKFEKSQKKG